MCGLVGVTSAATLTEPSKKAFYDMLYLDVLRGEDSTGVCAVSEVNGVDTVEVFKSLGAPSDFFLEHRKGWNSRDFTTNRPHTFIGHNRYATQGKVTVENAHPFEFDNVVGAHNGTVDKWSLRKFDGYKDFDVDSQIIYSHLNNNPIDSVWEDADGALALVWWDKRTNKLNMIRNSARPLYIVYTDDDKTVFWASEPGMIYLAAHRNQIKLKDVVEVPPNRLFTFGFSADHRMHHNERDLPPFVKKPVVHSYGSTGYYTGYEDWDGWNQNQRRNHRSQKKQNGPIVMGPKNRKPGQPANLAATQQGGKLLIITEYHEHTNNPNAFGFTQDGTPVRINIALKDAVEAKKKIIGRGADKGYYLTPTLYNSALPGNSLWVQWERLTWCRFKPGHYLIRNGDNAFEIHKTLELPPPAPNHAGTIKGFDDREYLPGAWITNTSCGCFNCFKVPDITEADTLTWFSEEDFLCDQCVETPLLQDFLLETKKRSA